MPTYLCHGFRWHRRLIRIFVILENLDDAAPDWIVKPSSSRAMLQRLYTKYDFLPSRKPGADEEDLQRDVKGKGKEIETEGGKTEPIHQDDNLTVPPSRVPALADSVLVNDWSAVKLLEEYDIEEMSISARPFAYVADYAVRIDLSANIDEERAKYEKLVNYRGEGDWLEKLRDELQKDEPIGWYIVVNADEERAAPSEDEEEEDEDDDSHVAYGHDDLVDNRREKLGVEQETHTRPKTAGALLSPSQNKPSRAGEPTLRHKLSRAGLRRLFGRKDSTAAE